MADERAKAAAVKAAELDKELDEFIQSMEKKSKGYEYKSGITEENWQKEFEKIPFFMNHSPSQEEIDNNPTLSALQSLKYEEDTPVARAEAYKDEGNVEYKKKNFKYAILAYSEGIKIRCDDDSMNAILHTNRATAQFCLGKDIQSSMSADSHLLAKAAANIYYDKMAAMGNNRSALNDATIARKFQPNYMKAIIRGASACFELHLYNDAVRWCDDGLLIEPENKKLLDIRSKSATEQKRMLRDERKAKAKEKKERCYKEALLSAVKSRGVRLEHDDDLWRSFSDGDVNAKVQLDSNGHLHWPVLFMYPEHGQTDMISSFDENDRFCDHLYTMFGEESPAWDVERKYNPQNLEVYFEDASCEKLCFVKNDSCLNEVLTDSRLLIRQRTPSFIVVVKDSPFRTKFRQRYQVEG